MKRLLLIVAMLMSVPSNAQYGDDGFCDGWEEGYKAGWCDGDSYCNAPFAPFCPFPRVGEHGYMAGYRRGILAGMGARSRSGY